MGEITIMANRRLSVRAWLWIIVTIVVVTAAAWLTYQRLNPDIQRDKLAVQLDWTMSAPYAAYIYADELGLYREAGLDVSFRPGKGADLTARLVSDGQADVGTNHVAATALGVAQGLNITSVGVIEQYPVTSLFALEATRLSSPTDIAGKRVGIRSYDISNVEYLALLKRHGLDSAAVTHIEIGFDPTPLIAKQVDVMYNYSFNMPVALRQSGIRLNELRVRDWGVQGYGSNLIVNLDALRKRRDVLRRFMAATAQGWRLAAENPDAAVSALVRRFPEIERATATASFRAQIGWLKGGATADTILCQERGKWQATLDTYTTGGYLARKPPLGRLYSNELLPGCR